jgi:hypothetical protein
MTSWRVYLLGVGDDSPEESENVMTETTTPAPVAKISLYSHSTDRSIIKLAYTVFTSARHLMMHGRYDFSGTVEQMAKFQKGMEIIGSSSLAERAANAIHNAHVVAAELAAAPAPAAPTTCQICGRVIKSKTGTIAHHGYKRPGTGWQTASCPGSKGLPYEVSCNLIPGVIAGTTNYAEVETARAAELKANPPAEVKKIYRRGYGANSEEVTKVYTRPEGFVFDTTSYSSSDYTSTLRSMVYGAEANAKAGWESVKFFQARLAAWVAPAK